MLGVTFLGTGSSQGIPSLLSDHPVNFSSDRKDKRLRSSIVITHEIEYQKYHYLIDCGPEFRGQLLRHPIDCIDGIFFTHEHADHTAGLDDIRAYCYRQGSIPIYGEARLLNNLATRFPHIFAKENRYPGAPRVREHTLKENETITLPSGLPLQSIRILHGDLPILGYRLGDFAYLTDVKTIPTDSFKKLESLDTLVISALRKESHPSHLSLAEALIIIEKIQPQQAYITHINHQLGFHKEISKKLPQNVCLAYDGLTITSN